VYVHPYPIPSSLSCNGALSTLYCTSPPPSSTEHINPTFYNIVNFKALFDNLNAPASLHPGPSSTHTIWSSYFHLLSWDSKIPLFPATLPSPPPRGAPSSLLPTSSCRFPPLSPSICHLASQRFMLWEEGDKNLVKTGLISNVTLPPIKIMIRAGTFPGFPRLGK
jgi:hypothetical protein